MIDERLIKYIDEKIRKILEDYLVAKNKTDTDQNKDKGEEKKEKNILFGSKEK
jgi:hypothetical protein